MNLRTATVTVPTSAERLFAYLANADNLPHWATEFCRALKKVNGKYKVDSPMGELFFQLRADPATGVIDMFAGPTEDQMASFPTRVISLPDSSSAYLFTITTVRLTSRVPPASP